MSIKFTFRIQYCLPTYDLNLRGNQEHHKLKEVLLLELGQAKYRNNLVVCALKTERTAIRTSKDHFSHQLPAPKAR